MAEKQYLVTITERKLQESAPDDKLTQLEAILTNIIAEINLSNGQADLRVTAVVEQ
jgi:hypothetical protein